MSAPEFHAFPEMPRGFKPAHYAADKMIWEALVEAGCDPDYDHTRVPCFMPVKTHGRPPEAYIHVVAADVAAQPGGHKACDYLKLHFGPPFTRKLLVLYTHDGIQKGMIGKELRDITRDAIGVDGLEFLYVEKPDMNPGARDLIRPAVGKAVGAS